MFRKTSDLPFSKDALGWFLPFMVMLMVFFATLTTAGTLSLNSMLSRWSRSLSGSLTVQILPFETDGRIDRKRTMQEAEEALAVLRKTPGIASANLLTDRQMKELLKPWIGGGAVLDDLPLPYLIDVRLMPDAETDLDMLRTLLKNRTPNATMDVHKLWLGKLIALTRRLDGLASLLLTLVITSTSIIVIYVTISSLSVHKPVIELLHLTGAHDSYIAVQYARRMGFLAFCGALPGFLFVLPILMTLSSAVAGIQGGLLAEARFDLAAKMLLCMIPLLATVLASLTAFWTVRGMLRRLL